MNTLTKSSKMSAPFTIRLNSKVKMKLEEEAKLQDRTLSYIVQEALESMTADMSYKRDVAINAYENSLKEKSFVSGESVDKWVESFGRNKKMKMPVADIIYK